MRQRKNLWRLGAAALALSLVAAACGDDDDDDASSDTTAGSSETTAASGGVTCDGLALAFFGALTGDAGNLGVNIRKGADLAVSEFNAANPDCQIELKDFDSQGDPDQAPALADAVIADSSIVGVVGPAFSGETNAAMPKFEEAGLPIVSPSATRVDLSTNGWKFFRRALANDGKQGPGIAKYIAGSGATAVGIIDDASDYGKGLADIVTSELGDAVVATDTIDPASSDFSAAVTKMKDANVDTVFFGGYYQAAGILVKQLRDAGVEATFVAGDGVLDIGFIEAAGPAAEGAIVTCTCAPKDSNAEFLASYQAKFNEDPATYGPEAYDAAWAFLNAIIAGNTSRGDINTYLTTYNHEGVTKTLSWDATGEVAGEAVYAYKIEGGAITAIGLI